MVACGDGLNDLTMIEYAGIGVAMDNAQPVLKEKSDFVTLSNDQDGVAEAVKHFLERNRMKIKETKYEDYRSTGL